MCGSCDHRCESVWRNADANSRCHLGGTKVVTAQSRVGVRDTGIIMTLPSEMPVSWSKSHGFEAMVQMICIAGGFCG